MGSSARVRFNEVPEKVPKARLGGFGAEPGQVQQGSEESSRRSGRLWCRARSGSTEFRRRFRRFRRRSGRLWCSQVRLNRVPEKVPGEGLGGFGAEPGQLQQVPEEVPKVKPGQVPKKAWEALLQSHVRFNRVSEKVPEKVWEALVQRRSRRRFREALVQSWCRECPGEGFGNLCCRARSGSNMFNRVSSAWLRSTLQKGLYNTNKTLQLLGIPQKLVFFLKSWTEQTRFDCKNTGNRN